MKDQTGRSFEKLVETVAQLFADPNTSVRKDVYIETEFGKRQFDVVIEQIVALAVLMTIVASMGGNAGTQTLTVAVRALATKDLTATNAFRIISREGMVGALNGVVFAVVMGGATWWWYGDPTLGVVLGLAMIVKFE